MAATPTLDDLRREEDRLLLASFDRTAALRLGLRLHDLAAEQGLPVAIEVAHGASPVFLALMPGGTPDNLDWVRRKRAVVQRFHKSSLYLRLLCEEQGVDFHARYHLRPADFVASGGAVPLAVRGTGIVGCAAVSGLPDIEDHRLVVTALADLGLIPPA